MDFKWIPGQGINQDSIERMKQHFKKPDNPPHVAWFMSPEPSYYSLVTEIEPHNWSVRDIENVLSDLGSGVKIFGRRQDWVESFHYIMPRVLQRYREENDLYRTIVNYLINLYTRGYIKPDSHIDVELQRELYFVDFAGGIIEEYPGFREDVFLTVGQAVMDHDLWKDGEMVEGTMWFYLVDPHVAYDASFLYAALFFCLMCLTSHEIPGWVQSMANIRGEHWRSEIKLWLGRLAKFRFYIHHPSEIPEVSERDAASIEELRKANGGDATTYEALTRSSRSKQDSIAYCLEAADLDWHHYVVGKDVPIDRVNDLIPMVNIETFMTEAMKYPHLELDYDWTS